jgi:hypothetical protein
LRNERAEGALRAGDIWIWVPGATKTSMDLVPGDNFEKLTNNNQLNIPVETDCEAYLSARLTLLASRLEEVNAMAVTGDLPDVDISDKGLKITPLDNSVPSTISPLADLILQYVATPKNYRNTDEVEMMTLATFYLSEEPAYPPAG